MTRRRTTVPVLLALVAAVGAASCSSPDAGDIRSVAASPTVSVTATPTTPPTAPAASPTSSPTPSPSPTASAVESSVHFSVLGDIGSTDASAAVLSSIADRDDDFTLAVGDLSYGADDAEDDWCRFVAARVGPAYPFQLVSGNHESDGENGDIDDFVRCLPNRLPGLVGTYGRQWYVDQPAEQPLVRVVMVSPALDFGSGEWSYDKGTAHHAWLRGAVSGAREAGIPWVVVGMHKPCLSMGRYRCDPGPELLGLLLDTGVDLVVNGHEHLYQRSRPLALGRGCETVRPGRFDADCVAGAGTRGTTFVTVGTGGQELRRVNPVDSERRYFAASSGRGREPSFGSLAVGVTADRLTATFVPVDGGDFTDRVVLTR